MSWLLFHLAQLTVIQKGGESKRRGRKSTSGGLRKSIPESSPPVKVSSTDFLEKKGIGISPDLFRGCI